jgi:hypothetical protein
MQDLLDGRNLPAAVRTELDLVRKQGARGSALPLAIAASNALIAVWIGSGSQGPT